MYTILTDPYLFIFFTVHLTNHVLFMLNPCLYILGQITTNNYNNIEIHIIFII